MHCYRPSVCLSRLLTQVMSRAMTNVADRHFRHQLRLGALTGFSLLMGPFVPNSVLGGDMAQDPNGFYCITWGARLAELPDLIQAEAGEHIYAYELKRGSPKVGDAAVESLRFVTYDGQFARVMIHYQGSQRHNQILTHLQSLFGPIDKTPGSMVRGLSQQFTWRGLQTEVNRTYNGAQDRGSIFIESRTLAPRFNDSVPE